MRNCYAVIGERQLCYHVCGDGPPVVLVFANSAELDALTEFLAVKFTVYSFDNPGYGGSEALTEPDVTMADMADALAEAMRTFGFGRTPVFGTHMGAAIAIELGVRHPDLVAALVLDGVPIFLPEECVRYEQLGYFDEIAPDVLGGQFARGWTRARDWQSFDPWCDRTQSALRLSGPTASPAELQSMMLANFRNAATSGKPYRAAFGFGPLAAERVASLTMPVTITALQDDTLAAHLVRLPTPKAGQEMIRLGADPGDLHRLVMARFDRCDVDPQRPCSGGPQDFLERRPAARSVSLPHGRVVYREMGPPSADVLLVIPDAPGSSAQAIETVITLAGLHRLVWVDLPGTGQSDRLPEADRTVAGIANVVARLCVEIGIETVVVYGVGFGSSIALELAVARPALVRGCILEGVLLCDMAERAALQEYYAPPIEIDPFGSHWYATWLRLRDSRIYWPWYARGPEAVRNVPVDLDGTRLHEWTLDVMARHASYADPIAAALSHDAAVALQRLAAPVLLLRTHHPLCRNVGIAAALAAPCLAVVADHQAPTLSSVTNFVAGLGATRLRREAHK